MTNQTEQTGDRPKSRRLRASDDSALSSYAYAIQRHGVALALAAKLGDAERVRVALDRLDSEMSAVRAWYRLARVRSFLRACGAAVGYVKTSN